jgi:hypothetical protein
VLEALVRRDLPIDHVRGSIERTASVVLLYLTDSPNSRVSDRRMKNRRPSAHLE